MWFDGPLGLCVNALLVLMGLVFLAVIGLLLWCLAATLKVVYWDPADDNRQLNSHVVRRVGPVKHAEKKRGNTLPHSLQSTGAG